ncbi:MAG TPA: CPXCG motif-containing cysteine-rich protein [Myxococcales bacterium]|nr:CPXCG motif-containing cysteine-rich protein [Myxococcales bacterium]HIN86342.1 CPXCG motif-containing cysteine-rich protein [Myxococcales bacterium]
MATPQDAVEIQCPWCREWVTLWLTLDDLGVMTVDCEVCCRPWRLHVSRDENALLRAEVSRE